LHHLGETPLSLKQRQEVVDRLAVVGLELERPLVGGDGVLDPSERPLCVARLVAIGAMAGRTAPCSRLS
jgi:hypothetical protein